MNSRTSVGASELSKKNNMYQALGDKTHSPSGIFLFRLFGFRQKPQSIAEGCGNEKWEEG